MASDINILENHKNLSMNRDVSLLKTNDNCSTHNYADYMKIA